MESKEELKLLLDILPHYKYKIYNMESGRYYVDLSVKFRMNELREYMRKLEFGTKKSMLRTLEYKHLSNKLNGMSYGPGLF